MAQIEELRRPAQVAGLPEPCPGSTQAAVWPGSWPDMPPASPVLPAWYYPPPCWYTPPPVEEPQPPGGAMPKLAYSVDEAAQVLGVSRCTVYKLIHRADFPALKVGHRQLISRDGLAAWVRKQAGG